ncbi:MAG: hypothetical protein SOV85_16370 [Clostridium sp.]|uniref:hypothetical protein n=1 Tax=Clostridium sp. TaxID=1506 RepID=UPI002A75EEEC|nr:hypothetical protein [Clostridium sp.]MDY2632899.1 hypothetical protein [Clostridium sp.]
MLMIAGCGKGSFSKAYTYSVTTGDSVKIKLNTSDNYDISADMPFKITKDGEVLSQGTFMQGEMYNQYVESAQYDEKVKVIDSGKIGENEFLFYEYNNSEFNYVVLVRDSNTGLIIGNNVSEESARECFERLEISLE